MSLNFSKRSGQFPPGLSSGNMPGFQFSPQSSSFNNQSFHASSSTSASSAIIQSQPSQAQELKAGDIPDIERLRKLKEAILAGQHPQFKAVPNPDALASLWRGPHPASQAAKDQQPQQKSGKAESISLPQAPSQPEVKSSAVVEKVSVDSRTVTTSTSSMAGAGDDAVQSNADPSGANDSSRPEPSTKQPSVLIPPKTITAEPLTPNVTTTASLVTSGASGAIQEPNRALYASDQPSSKLPLPDSKDTSAYRFSEHDKDRDRGYERERPGYPTYDSKYESVRYPYPPDRRDSSRDSIRYAPRYNDPRYDRDHDWNRDRGWEMRERERERDRLRERDRVEYEKARQIMDRRALPAPVLEPRMPLDRPGLTDNVPPHPEQRPTEHPHQNASVSSHDERHSDASSTVESRSATEPRPQEPLVLGSNASQPPHKEPHPRPSTPIPSGRIEGPVENAPSRSVPPTFEQARTDSVNVVQASETDQHRTSHVVTTALPKTEDPPDRIQSLSITPTTASAPAEHRITPIAQPSLPSMSQPATATSSVEQRAESAQATTEVVSRTSVAPDTHPGMPPRQGERDSVRPYYPVSAEPRPVLPHPVSSRRPSGPLYEGPRERVLSASSYHDGVSLSPGGPRTYPEEDVRLPLGGEGPRRAENYYPPPPLPSSGLERRPPMGHWRERHGNIPIDEKRGYPMLDRNAVGRPPPASWERDRIEYEPWDKKYPPPPPPPPPHHWEPDYDDRFIPRDAVRYLPTPELIPRDGYPQNPRIRPRSPSPPERPMLYDEAHRAPKRVRDDYDRPPYYDDRRPEYPPRGPSPGFYDARPPMVPRGGSPYGRERVPDPYRRDMPPPPPMESPPPFYPPRERYPPR